MGDEEAAAAKIQLFFDIRFTYHYVAWQKEQVSIIIDLLNGPQFLLLPRLP